MERLTLKNYSGYTCNKLASEFDGGELIRANQKLGPLEDIEEELGIDLISLFKVLKQKEVYIREGFCPEAGEYLEIDKILPIYLDYVGNNEEYDDFINKEWVLTFTEQEDEFDEYEMLVRLKDYGKTWAFTKDELMELSRRRGVSNGRNCGLLQTITKD